MNQVILIGRLTRDPEMRFIPSTGTAVARFSLAVNREVKRDGQPDADFINIKVFGKGAENVSKYVKKGRLVAVNGQLRNNFYEDKNGIKHYNQEIVAKRVEFLEYGSQQAKPQEDQLSSFDGFQPIDSDDDIPF